MKERWLRELTDFAQLATILGVLATLILGIVSYSTYHSLYLLDTYGTPIMVGVGILDVIAILLNLNLKLSEPALDLQVASAARSRKLIELALAERYIREHTALYRHYNIEAVQDLLSGRIGSGGPNVILADDEVVIIVQKIRDEYEMGPIADYNLPGYVDPDEAIDLSAL